MRNGQQGHVSLQGLGRGGEGLSCGWAGRQETSGTILIPGREWDRTKQNQAKAIRCISGAAAPPPTQWQTLCPSILPAGRWGGHRLHQDNSARQCQGRGCRAVAEVGCAAAVAAHCCLTYPRGPSERPSVGSRGGWAQSTGVICGPSKPGRGGPETLCALAAPSPPSSSHLFPR